MKKLAALLFTLSGLIFLQACNTHSNTQTSTQASTKASKTLEDNNFAGVYIYGHEVNAFQPCGQSENYWVTGSDIQLANIENQYNKITTQAYEKTYIVFTGKHIRNATDGFAMDYDGQVKLDKLIELRKTSTNDCINN